MAENILSLLIEIVIFIITKSIEIVFTLSGYLLRLFLAIFQIAKSYGPTGISISFLLLIPIIYLIGKHFFDTVKKIFVFGIILVLLFILGFLLA